MTGALYYPPANRTAQWYADDFDGTKFTSMEKLLLHTTEGSGWPGYQKGATAPNMTGLPDFSAKRIIWRQHYPINMSSRALRRTQTQPTNTDHVFQVELIGTCVRGGPGPYWPDASDWALEEIADLLVFLNEEWGIPISSTVTWRAYEARGDSQRLTNAEYDAYRGVLGHQHAPQNDHRDPGHLKVSRIIELAKSKTVVANKLVIENKEYDMATITEGDLLRIVTNAIAAQRDDISADVWNRFKVRDAKGDPVVSFVNVLQDLRNFLQTQPPINPVPIKPEVPQGVILRNLLAYATANPGSFGNSDVTKMAITLAEMIATDLNGTTAKAKS